MTTVNLIWKQEQDVKDGTSLSGEFLIHSNINISKTPFGIFLVQQTVVQAVNGDTTPLPFTVMFHGEIIDRKAATLTEALAFANAWYNERAVAIYQDFLAQVAKETPQVSTPTATAPAVAVENPKQQAGISG